MDSVPHWKRGPRRCEPCRHYWMLDPGSRGCRRGDRCYFIHSSAHMTPAMKTLISHVEQNVVLSGCPRPPDKQPSIRQNYPAPWPVHGISHLRADGITYDAKPQEENWGDNAPPQLQEPLAYSKRARLSAGTRPQAPAGPDQKGPYPWSNIRQAPRRNRSPPRPAKSASHRGSGSTYDDIRKKHNKSA